MMFSKILNERRDNIEIYDDHLSPRSITLTGCKLQIKRFIICHGPHRPYLGNPVNISSSNYRRPHHARLL